MYTKQQFGRELKSLLTQQKISAASIGSWAHAKYYDYIDKIDPHSGFGEFLLQLGTMEMGPEFERSHKELNNIADRLIAGEDVKL